ncbi:MAG: cardiolipin synthase [Armatimonadetes bacterium]|nr:cardiolipin synthase [Armatimonadota bacterium]
MLGYLGSVLAVLLPILHAAGVLSAIHAVLHARTPQGAIAWSMSLVTFPYVSLPLYWVLGRDKFNGYVQALRAGNLSRYRHREVAEFLRLLEPFRDTGDDEDQTTFERLARMPFTTHNRVDLLIDAEKAFASIFEGMRAARNYVLVLFYIIDDDEAGRQFKARLIETARRGIRTYLLYDEVGCMKLPWGYIRELEEAGVEVHAFQTTRGRDNLLQYNFRNHRKIVVVDGRIGYTGGFNVGDDYFGRNPFYGSWRDTHVRVEGPAVQGLQLAFCEDWYWATGTLPELEWSPGAAPGGSHSAVYLSIQPTDDLAVGVLFFVHCINAANERLWIASPYFIPDPSVMDALHLAALRGVDVRIIIPARWDILMCWLAAYSYLPELEETGIRVYRYEAGHPHQKVVLIDDRYAWVGSANMDNRSMRLNFEGNLVVKGSRFARDVETMLIQDMENSRLVLEGDYQRRSLPFKIAVQLARLFTPIL